MKKDEERLRESLLSEVRILRQRVAELEAASAVGARDFEKQFAAQMPLGMHFFDLHPDGRLVLADANPAADAILGIENARLVGMTLEEAFPALRETEVPERYRQVAVQGIPWNAERIVYAAENMSRVFQVYAFPTRPGSMGALFMDVTARVRTEDALREKVVQLTTLVDNLIRGALFEDQYRRVVHTNRVFCTMFNICSPDRVIGMDFATVIELIKPLFGDPEGFVRGIDALATARVAVRGERLTLGDGRVLERDYMPLMIEGEYYGNLWLYHDVTAHVRAEEALRLNAERLGVLLKLNQMRTASLQQIADFALEAAVRLTRSEVGYLAFVNEDETVLTIYTWSKRAMEACTLADKPLVYPLDTTGLWGETLRQRRPIVTNDYAAPSPWKKNYPAGHIPLRSHLGVPIFAGDHIVIVVGVANKPDDYDETDIQQLTLLMEDVWQLIEHHRTEQALRVSLEKYRVLFESFPLGITISDEAGRILESNRASEKLLGVSMERSRQYTIDGPEWRIIRLDGTPMPPEEFASVRALRENRLIENVEMGVVKDDETVSWLSVTAAPIPLEGYGVAVAYSDIGARIQSEKKFYQEHDLSRALAEATAVLSRSLDPDEVLDQLLEQVSRVIPNDAANVMLVDEQQHARIVRWRGYERLGAAEYVAHVVFNVQEVANLRQMAESGEAMVIPDTALYADWLEIPEVAWLRSYVGAPIIAHGNLLGFLNVDSKTPGFFTPAHASSLRLFSYHAAVALENARLYQQVQESETYFHALFDQASDAILIQNLQDAIVDANQRACEMLGYTRAELLRLTVADLQAPESRGIAGQIIKNELAQHKGMPFEGMDIRKDGTRVPVEVTTSPLRVGERDLALSIVRDITERKEIEERLRRQERLAAIGQLAAGIAHDFRNLLTTIILYAQLGMRKPNVPPSLISNLEIIVGEARKATHLVQQILDFSSRALIERQSLDLAEFIGDVFAILRRTLPENIHIALEVGAGRFIVEADPGRMQQVLTNLALNARDAMPAGGTLRVRLERLYLRPDTPPPLPEMARYLENAGGRPANPAWICLSVTDTGIGMTDSVRARLFEPFFTTKEAGKGTGLGLAQVYGIIRQHDGHIGVETEVGKGTTFRIYLPAAVGEAMEKVEEAAVVPRGHGETILLVEDNNNLREAGCDILTELGYRVLTATNGREALEVFRTSPEIALVITDLVMPEMGGDALLQELKRLPTACKVLAITGYTMQVGVRALKLAGFFDVVHKPFDADTLGQVIQRALSEG